MLSTADNPRYKAGQVWAYHTRPHETGSTLTILKIENDDRQGSIVHIHIQGLQIKNPHDTLGLTSVITHLPCSKEAIDQSVTEVLKADASLPDYEQGYWEWREAFDTGNAGIWGIPAAKIVEAMETVLNQQSQTLP